MPIETKKQISKRTILIILFSITVVVGILSVFIYFKNNQPKDNVQAVQSQTPPINENPTSIEPDMVPPIMSSDQTLLQAPAITTPKEVTKETTVNTPVAPTTTPKPKPSPVLPLPATSTQNPKPVIEQKPVQPPIEKSEPSTSSPSTTQNQDRGAFDI